MSHLIGVAPDRQPVHRYSGSIRIVAPADRLELKCPRCGELNRCALEQNEPQCWCGAKPRSNGESQAHLASPCYCQTCLLEAKQSGEIATFDADGALGRNFLLARGTCCGNRCQNCPYNWSAVINQPTANEG